jgi:hypothetical protein
MSISLPSTVCSTMRCRTISNMAFAQYGAIPVMPILPGTTLAIARAGSVT